MANEETKSHPKKVGKFYVGNSTFSVYVEMTRQLEEEGWTPVREETRVGLCDLVLGDRRSIPYAILRVEPMAPDSFFGGKRWVNYFLRSNHLTMKTFMADTLQAMDTTSSSWMPETYTVGGNQKIKADDREALMKVVEADPEAIWIVKPGSGAKGKGIFLSKGPEKIQELITSHNETSRSVYAVQRYLVRPLLLSHDRKFDLRVWVCLQSPYHIYAFTQVSCRTASEPFDLTNLDNVYSHLTNHCLQESSPHYGQYEEGNEMWLPELEAYLTKEKGEAEGVVKEKILPNASDIIVRTLLAMRPEMQVYPDEGYECFQLFGYDLLIQEDYSLQLIEINGSPGIADRWLQTVVQEMRRLLGCVSDGTEVRPEREEEEAPSNVAERARKWNIQEAEMLLLWKEGDAIPEGLSEEVRL